MPFAVILAANTALPKSSLDVTGDSFLYAHVLYQWQGPCFILLAMYNT